MKEKTKQNQEPLLKIDLREILSFTDIYTVIMLVIYTILAIICYQKIENATGWILINIFIIAGVISIATVDSKINAGRIFSLFRKIYFAPLVFFIYTQAQVYIRVINPHDYDNLLISWDKAIFGINPTLWLKGISFPVLTEYLQFSYMTYFFMPLINGIELHLRKEDENFRIFSRIIVFAFFLSYLCYFALPAIGPRFTLHNFSSNDLELPGLFLTNFFRGFVNSGGGIPDGSLTPEIFVNRDCMPSGHTWMTLVNIYLGFKFKSRFRWMFFVFGISLIFATVYLRYHYVVDVIAGIILAFATIKLEAGLRKILGTFGLKGD